MLSVAPYLEITFDAFWLSGIKINSLNLSDLVGLATLELLEHQVFREGLEGPVSRS
jgi:hypothetical protein